MSILIGSLEFQGPIRDFELLAPIPAVYGILVQTNEEYELIEFGETASLTETIFNHPNLEQWERAGLEISFCVYYTQGLSPAERAELKLALDAEIEDINAAA